MWVKKDGTQIEFKPNQWYNDFYPQYNDKLKIFVASDLDFSSDAFVLPRYTAFSWKDKNDTGVSLFFCSDDEISYETGKNGTLKYALAVCDGSVLSPKICESDETSAVIREIVREWETRQLISGQRSKAQHEQTSIWYHSFWTGLNRYNDTFFVDENSNLYSRFACNNELPYNTTKNLDKQQLKREAEWQTLFPSEMTAVLIERTEGNLTEVKMVWKNTKPGPVPLGQCLCFIQYLMSTEMLILLIILQLSILVTFLMIIRRFCSPCRKN